MRSAFLLAILSTACGSSVAPRLPVVRSGASQVSGKFDSSAGDYRAANSALYEFDAAPPDDVDVLPGEYEPLSNFLVGWPTDLLASSTLKPFFFDVVKHASARVPVNIIVSSRADKQVAQSALRSWGANMSNVDFFIYPLEVLNPSLGETGNAFWMRDYGPLAVRTKPDASGYSGMRYIDTSYYGYRPKDDAVPTELAQYYGVPVSRPRLHQEGGNFLSDGQGRCIATTHTLDENSAAFGYTQSDVNRIYQQYFGCTQITILSKMSGEVTGHVDMYATVNAPGEVIVGQVMTPSDDIDNAQILDDAAQKLSAAGFLVRRIPMPKEFQFDGIDGSGVARKITAYPTYTNSIAVAAPGGDAGAVLIPSYADDAGVDQFLPQAIAVFQDAFPGREIIPVNASSILYNAGVIHCTTMTIAAR